MDCHEDGRTLQSPKSKRPRAGGIVPVPSNVSQPTAPILFSPIRVVPPRWGLLARAFVRSVAGANVGPAGQFATGSLFFYFLFASLLVCGGSQFPQMVVFSVA